ncbi:MAG: DUF1007 family protein [Hyphomicrobium sp.]
MTPRLMSGLRYGNIRPRAATATCLALGLLAAATPALAHPHVWVTFETTVVYDKGAITAFEHVWTFDDMYTAMAVQGLDKNGDGKYDREELAELAQVNMDGLKDFDYFTFPKLGDAALKVAPPTEPWLEHTNGILRLHFKLPLTQPVLAEAEGFNFSVFDPSYFIAFEPEQTDAFKLASAPDGCSAAVLDPAADKSAEEAKKLGDAMAQQLGIPDATGSLGVAKTVSVSCKKS